MASREEVAGAPGRWYFCIKRYSHLSPLLPFLLSLSLSLSQLCACKVVLGSPEARGKRGGLWERAAEERGGWCVPGRRSLKTFSAQLSWKAWPPSFLSDTPLLFFLSCSFFEPFYLFFSLSLNPPHPFPTRRFFYRRTGESRPWSVPRFAAMARGPWQCIALN